MIEYGEEHYRDLCRSGRVAIEISTIEEKRKDALRRFWLFGIVAAWLVLVFGGIVAALPLGKAGRALKLPVLETLAEKGGLTYLESGFDPPVYPEARKALFGNWLSSQSFTDLFHGSDDEGRRFVLYEGTLTRRQGKNTHTVFSGQMYAWQRRSKGGSEIVIVPDRGIFNFFKPLSGMERVKFESDPDFEKRFEVYAYEPQQAQMVIGAELH